MHNELKAEADFETRSACSLKDCGAWVYSLHPTTEIMCLVYRLPYWEDGRTALWTPPYPRLGIPENFDGETLLELCAWIEDGGLLEAHSAFFERSIWTNILAPRFGFPLPDGATWRCSAAKAAAHALPRKLEEAGAALKLAIRKDTEGHKLMMKLSKPRKPRKKEREAWVAAGKRLEDMPLLWWEDLPSFQRLWQYCASDVLAEEALSEALDDLSPTETPNYILDQQINQRGFQLDLSAVSMALSLIASETSLLNTELTRITNGAVTRATQRDRMKAWLKNEGLHLEDTTGATIDDVLAGELDSVSPPARRALEILRTLGRSSTAKYEKMRSWAAPDGRVRGGLLYHGATTGRWSGAGVQPHNFPKGTIKGFDMEEAWELIKTSDRSLIMNKYPSVMEALAAALRGAIVPTTGNELFVADYAGIEVRVLFWSADDKVGLKLLSTGADPYCALASDIYQRTVTKADSNERQLGKAGILGCGYGMGAAKFVATAATWGIIIDDEMSQTVVDTYRSKFWRVKKYWYESEDAACDAVRSPGRVVPNGKCAWQRVIDKRRGTDFLFCILPNGRRLAYPFPELRERETPWGAVKWALTFMGVDTYSKKWKRLHTYGGSIVENQVQAISRDILADAFQRLEASGVYSTVLGVHDEAVCEVAEGAGSLHEFEALMTQRPTWGTDIPIGVDSWKGLRYRK